MVFCVWLLSPQAAKSVYMRSLHAASKEGTGRSRQHEMGMVPRNCLLVEDAGAINLDSINEYESLGGGSQQLEQKLMD